MSPSPVPDATGIEHAADRFAFLAAAGEALASSLDYEETLRHLARLAVPALGDLCVVDLLDNGRVRRIGLAHVLPDKRRLVEELAARFPPTSQSPSPAGRVLASGRTELLEVVDTEVIRSHTLDAGHADLIASIGMRSHIAVPMIVRGQMLGVISLGITESDRRYTADDVAIAEEIARRAGMAVENARLYRAAQEEISRRRAVESALRFSERRYRAIVEQSPLSTQVLAPDGSTRQVNRAWEALWGLTLPQIADYNVLQDPQLDAYGITPLLRRAFAGETVQLPTIAYDLDATLPRRSLHSGAVRWVAAQAYPVRGDDGAVHEVVLIHTDVTEARSTEQRLRESQERLNHALAAASMVVWDWDLATGFVECSENAVDVWGMRVGSAADFVSLIHPDDIDRVNAAAAATIEHDRPYHCEYRLRGSDGMERWMQSRGDLQRDDQGRPVRMLGATLDVSHLKQAELIPQLLADAGRVLGTSLDYATTLAELSRILVPRIADWYAVDLLTPEGELERVAVHHVDPRRVDMARRLFEQYPPRRGDPIGSWKVIASGEPEWAPDIPRELLAGVAKSEEHLALLTGLDLRSYITVPLVARGTTIGVLTLVQAESGRRYQARDVDLAADIARRVAAAVDNARLFAQLQLEHRRKDEFLATLAHELRNPLAPIRNGIAVLAASPDAGTQARVHAIMERQLAQMARLIDDLLDLSRVTRGAIELRSERVAVASIVDAALETSRHALDAAGIELVVDLPPHPLWLDADPTRLAQVVTNLLSNAAKFTPRGGRVTVTAGEADGRLQLAVTDTGIGIEPERLGQVFEMFVRGPDSAAQGGLGIGLTLARRLVELHGGSLHAESAGRGHGSRFVARLPLAHAPASAEATPGTAPMQGARRRRVLVVDDNLDAAETLAMLLGLEGHEVHTAANGAAALALATRLRPELAFLDLGLPDIGGLELAGRMRALPGLDGLRLVALTGWGRDEDRALARAAGFDAHLTKPVDSAAVFAEVARLDGA